MRWSPFQSSNIWAFFGPYRSTFQSAIRDAFKPSKSPTLCITEYRAYSLVFADQHTFWTAYIATNHFPYSSSVGNTNSGPVQYSESHPFFAPFIGALSLSQR